MKDEITSRRRAKKEILSVLDDYDYLYDKNKKDIVTANDLFEYELYSTLKDKEKFDAYKNNLNDILRKNYNYGAFVEKVEVCSGDTKEIGIGYNFANEYARWIFYKKENGKLEINRSFTIKYKENGGSYGPVHPPFLDEKEFDKHMTKLTYKEVSRAYDRLVKASEKTKIEFNVKALNANLKVSNNTYAGIVICDPKEKFICIDKWYDDDENIVRTYVSKTPSNYILDNDKKTEELFSRLEISLYDLPEKIERKVIDSKEDDKAKKLIMQKVRRIYNDR